MYRFLGIVTYGCKGLWYFFKIHILYLLVIEIDLEYTESASRFLPLTDKWKNGSEKYLDIVSCRNAQRDDYYQGRI